MSKPQWMPGAGKRTNYDRTPQALLREFLTQVKSGINSSYALRTFGILKEQLSQEQTAKLKTAWLHYVAGTDVKSFEDVVNKLISHFEYSNER